MPQEGERTRQEEIPSNLTLMEAYPNLKTTRRRSTRLNRVAIRDEPISSTSTTETNNPVTISKSKSKQKKKTPAVAPIHKMVSPYTPQQFFDQPANITNGQLLAMNPKFGLTVGCKTT